MRWLLWAAVLCGASGCAGFKAVERGEWKLVYADAARREADAPREVIDRDAYEAEVTEGNRRGWEPQAGFAFPQLQDTDTVGLKVGEVAGFRIDEATEAELSVDGNAVEVYWGRVEKRDGWNVDTDVTVKESALYVKGAREGTATLRLVRGPASKDVKVSVKAR